MIRANQIARNVTAVVLAFCGLPILWQLVGMVRDSFNVSASHGVAALVALLAVALLWPVSVVVLWQIMGEGADSER